MTENFDHTLYFLIAGFLIFLLREAFRNYIFRNTGNSESDNPLSYIDPIGLGLLGLYGLSWGGITSIRRKDNIVTYIASEVFFLVLMLSAVGYYKIHAPFTIIEWKIFIVSIVKLNWALFILNCVPIPPFDASFFYTQNLGKVNIIIQTVFKVIVVILTVLGYINVDILGTNFVLDFFGIQEQ